MSVLCVMNDWRQGRALSAELSQSLAKCEEERTEVARERNDLEVAVDKLRGELGFVAEAKKQIQHQVGGEWDRGEEGERREETDTT